MSTKKQIRLLVFVVALPLLAFGVYSKRLAIFDAYRMYNYTPSSEAVKLADDTTMNKTARRLFYVYRPAVLDKTMFNAYCRNNEYTIVLGCYRSGMGIYIYDVKDERLYGIEQVTAAHEYLHAVYDRLSTQEKNKVNQLTSDAFARLQNPRVRETIELYRKNDPKVVPNELHSILGTEVRELSEELEAHYAKYFTNRLKIVEFSEGYEKAFDEREKQIESYDSQLKILLEQVNSLKDSLDSQDSRLTSERSKVESSQDSAVIADYNRRIESYNSDIEKVKNLVNQYNTILEKRNALVLEEKDLSKAIDSRDVIPEE